MTKKIMISAISLIALVSLVLVGSQANAIMIQGGLIAYWPFDGDPNDAVGTNDGTLQGTAHYVTGQVGQAVACSNKDVVDYVLLTRTETINGNWTAATWMYVPDAVGEVPSGQDVGGFLSGGMYDIRLPGQHGTIDVANPGITDLVANVNGAWDGLDSQTTAYIPPLNTWVYLTFVGSDTNGSGQTDQCELFVNSESKGKLIYAETTGTNGSESGNTMAHILTYNRIGQIEAYPTFASPVMNYDEVTVWDRALSDKEVVYLFNGTPCALDPSPENYAVGVETNVTLSWTAPEGSGHTYDVFLNGTNVSPGQTSTTYGPLSLAKDRTYAWRINMSDPNRQGATWYFKTISPKASNPSPGNNSTAIAKNAMLGWDPGEESGSTAPDTHTIYFDPNEAKVTAGDASVKVSGSPQAGLTFDPDLDWGIKYFWRVDENYSGNPTATGDVWNFTVAATVQCGAIEGDLTGDCLVNLDDIAQLAANWLTCTYTNDDCPTL